MLCYKGIDNPAYYRLVEDDPQYYMDYTGTGNSLNMRHPHRAATHHGFAALLDHRNARGRLPLRSGGDPGTGAQDVDRLSAFFDIIHQDPIISQVKLIAEPWDVGEGGYQVGRFPVLWSEWNGIYRDTMRDLLARPQDSTLGQFASRFTGSSDLYENTGRKPHASVNFITAHDGFTLHDLVTYEQKHNEANLEDNKDGTDDNRSCNYGVEGETDDPAINDVRARQVRNFLTTLLLSQGVPMILRRRRDRTHAARQQQRLLPGQRADLVRLGACRREPEGIHRPADRAAPGSSGLPSPRLVPGPVDPRLGDAR